MAGLTRQLCITELFHALFLNNKQTLHDMHQSTSAVMGATYRAAAGMARRGAQANISLSNHHALHHGPQVKPVQRR